MDYILAPWKILVIVIEIIIIIRAAIIIVIVVVIISLLSENTALLGGLESSRQGYVEFLVLLHFRKIARDQIA